MEPLDKLELIIKGTVKEKRAERDRCRKKDDPYGASPLYILGLDQEIDTLSWMLTKLEAIKENHHSVRDEMLLKMHGSEK